MGDQGLVPVRLSCFAIINSYRLKILNANESILVIVQIRGRVICKRKQLQGGDALQIKEVEGDSISMGAVDYLLEFLKAFSATSLRLLLCVTDILPKTSSYFVRNVLPK